LKLEWAEQKLGEAAHTSKTSTNRIKIKEYIGINRINTTTYDIAGGFG